jgi:hypothetical protein
MKLKNWTTATAHLMGFKSSIHLPNSSEFRIQNSSEINTDVEINPEEIDEDILLSRFYELADYVEGVVDYIAGFVAKITENQVQMPYLYSKFVGE